MTSRRDFLKLLSLSVLALPADSQFQWDFTKSRVADLDFPRPQSPDYWKTIRSFFPMPRDQAFFNTGTLGAQPAVVVEATVEHLKRVASRIAEWDYSGDDWISGYRPYPGLREKLARLLNATTKEIALTENATMAMNTIANGLDLRPGDEVLSTDQEHSGGRSGWQLKAKRYGTVYRALEIPSPLTDPGQIIEVFKTAVTPRTRVLAVSHIFSGNGNILPVKALTELASKHGIFTVVDGAQALGQVAVDVQDIGCDAYFGSLHKWMLAPPGTGFLYVRRDRIEEIWTTLAGGHWDDHEDDGYRLSQRGTGNLSLLMGLNAAIDFHNALGPSRIYARIKELGDYLREGLRRIKNVEIFTCLHPAMNAGMTAYNIRGMKPGVLTDQLWERKKIRTRGVRQCTHIYNSMEELDATLEVVRDLARL